MRPITRALGVALVGTALLSGASVASAEPVTVESETGTITWQPCAEDPAVDCGTLELPVDWAKPRGEKFDLAVARRKATDPARRTGIMLINPGGPGGSGVNSALGADEFFSPEVQAQFDIIGFDPRGVARSAPVQCSLELLRNPVSNYPTNQREFDALAAYNRQLRDDCRKNTGPIYDHVDTLSVIQDMDAIRKALGERKINYYGVSYGTLIGQQYAERYGDRIRAMVIDSNMDHSLGTRDFMATEAVTAEDSFTEWVKWCDRTASCALHGQDVAKVWDDLLARADRGELHDPADPTYTITAQDLIGLAFGSFYGPDWKFLTDTVAELVAQQPPAKVRTFAAEVGRNPFPAVFCQDWRLPIRDFAEYSRLREMELKLAPHMRGGSLGHIAATACIGWPERINNPQHRLDIDDTPKILMLNALHDPATGYAWAANAHRQSRDTTVFVTYEGWGHRVYDRSECTRGLTDAYLLTLKTPKNGTRCAAVEPPETPAAAEAGAARLPGSVPGRF